MHTRLKMFALLVGSLAVLGLAGCEVKLDHGKLEGDLRSAFKAKALPLTAVSCPHDLVLKQGTAFTCSITDEGGTTAIIDVTATDAKGTVKWDLRGKYEDTRVVGDRLEANISKTVQDQKIDVTCPSKNMLVKKGVTFTCDVKVGDKNSKIQFTCTSDTGTWDTKLL